MNDIYEGFEEVRDFGLDWDDEIENDGPEFILLPAGDYDFTVIDFERSRHPGSEKLPACNKAVLHIRLDGGEAGTTTLKHNLFLHSKTEGMLCAFFAAIGQRKHGEKMRMNWNSVAGSHGRCKVEVREWKNNDGETRQSNQIKKFYEAEQTSPSTSTSLEQKEEQVRITQKTQFDPGRF